MHRIRIATTVRQCPALAQMFFDVKARQLRLSPAGDRLAAVGVAGAVSLWNTKNGQRLGEALALDVTSLEISPDGQWLMTLGGDGAVRLWSAATGLPHGNPLTHGLPIRAAVFSPDSKWIATAAPDKVRIWDTGSTKPALKIDKEVRSLAFRADGKKLIGVSEGPKKKGELHLWDLTTGKDEPLTMPTKPGTPSIRSAGFSRDGKRIYAVADEEGRSAEDRANGSGQDGARPGVQPANRPVLPAGRYGHARYGAAGQQARLRAQAR
jgi:WD40 repeat protein